MTSRGQRRRCWTLKLKAKKKKKQLPEVCVSVRVCALRVLPCQCTRRLCRRFGTESRL